MQNRACERVTLRVAFQARANSSIHRCWQSPWTDGSALPHVTASLLPHKGQSTQWDEADKKIALAWKKRHSMDTARCCAWTGSMWTLAKILCMLKNITSWHPHKKFAPSLKLYISYFQSKTAVYRVMDTFNIAKRLSCCKKMLLVGSRYICKNEGSNSTISLKWFCLCTTNMLNLKTCSWARCSGWRKDLQHRARCVAACLTWTNTPVAHWQDSSQTMCRHVISFIGYPQWHKKMRDWLESENLVGIYDEVYARVTSRASFHIDNKVENDIS